jgi:Uma2 family endonuclease
MLLDIEKKATVQDYERLEEGAPYQLIGGELIMTPSPTAFHQSIIYRLILKLGNFVEQKRLGVILQSPIDVYLSDEDVYQPDLIFIRADRAKGLRKDKLRIVPDLVVEVLSPSTAYYDFTRKKEMYCARGVEEYWIVDPEAETIEVMIKQEEIYRTERLLHNSEILESTMFSGFSMKVEDIFVF